MIGVRFKPCFNSIGSRKSDRQKIQSLLQSFVWFGTTESQKPAASLTEAFAAQTGDSKIIVRTFQL